MVPAHEAEPDCCRIRILWQIVATSGQLLHNLAGTPSRGWLTAHLASATTHQNGGVSGAGQRRP